MRYISMIGTLLLFVVALIGCSTSSPSPLPTSERSSSEAPALPTDSSPQLAEVTAVPQATASAVVPTDSVPSPTPVPSPSPLATATASPTPSAPVRPTPIPTISAAYAPPVPSDIALPEYDPDPELLPMIRTVVQCRFPNAVYDPELHREAMEDIIRRARYGHVMYGHLTDEFFLAVPYYVEVLGLKYRPFGIQIEPLREVFRQNPSCDAILARLDEIWYQPERFTAEPSFFSLFLTDDELYGNIGVYIVYE